jgi:hypothetical protein
MPSTKRDGNYRYTLYVADDQYMRGSDRYHCNARLRVSQVEGTSVAKLLSRRRHDYRPVVGAEHVVRSERSSPNNGLRRRRTR